MSINKYKKIDLINIASNYNIPIKNRQKKIKTKAELFDTLKKRNKLVGGDNNNFQYYNELLHLISIYKSNLKKIPILEYFDKNPKNYIMKFLFYLEYKHGILTNLFQQDRNEIHSYVFYKKDDKNHKKNSSRFIKETSKNIKVILLKNDEKYIHNMIIYLNKNYRLSKTGSCLPQSKTIRIRTEEASYFHYFDGFVFCIENNNPYIKKIEDNIKHTFNVGDISNTINGNYIPLQQNNENSNIQCLNYKKLLNVLKKPMVIKNIYMNKNNILQSFFNNYNSTIIIPKNSLNSNNTNTCNHNLFNLIIKENIDKFHYQTMFQIYNDGKFQTGIDEGGITRKIFDIFYKSYMNKYFEVIDKFHFLKSSIDEVNFIQATNKLILIALRSKVSIIIKLNKDIIKLFEKINEFNNVNHYIDSLDLNKQNLINEFTKQGNFSYLNEEKVKIIISNNATLQNVISKNNSNKFELKFGCYDEYTDEIKRHIIFRIYLNKLTLCNYKKFLIMYNWYKTYWVPDLYNINTDALRIAGFTMTGVTNTYLQNFGCKFSSHIDYSEEIFLSKVYVINNDNEKKYSISDYAKSREKYLGQSKFNKLKKRIGRKEHTNILIKSKNLALIIDYISKNDDNRRRFNKYVTGSEYNDSSIEIKFYYRSNDGRSPIKVHTCFNSLDVFIEPEFDSINDLDRLIKSENGNTQFMNDNND
jgi:hypothetical protein